MIEEYKWIFELAKIILTAFLSVITTLIATNYTFNKNRPIEKYKIAYERVYYPIYRIMRDKNKNIVQKINDCNGYITKYEKYVDRSTLIAYKYLTQQVQ